MKYLILYFSLLVGMPSVLAQKVSSEMTPLKSIVNSSDYKTDSTRVSYVMKRCSAIYSVTGAVMSEKMGESKLGKEMSEMGALYADGSMRMDKAIQKSRNSKSAMTDDEWIKTTMDMINRISQIYIEDMKKSIDRTGDYFSESYKSDIDICKNLNKYPRK